MGSTVTATLLFTDCVGSTDLLDRVGADRAEQLRREQFGLLRDAIADHGGREVKNLGDGLMVAFDSAFAAVSCAATMQRAIETRNRRRNVVEPLAVRIGISAGDCDVESGDYFGPPVNEAARLCASANGGQVLVSEFARAMVASRGGVEFAAVGPLELKGFAESMPTFELVWRVPIEQQVTRLPGELDRRVLGAFVGRRSEREELAEVWKAATAGTQRVVLIAGEPGVGKTRLAAEIARSVHDDGGIVLFGRCSEEPLLPYEPFVLALRDYAAHLSSRDLIEQTRVGTAQLVRLIPDLVARLPSPGGDLRADPQAERFLLFDAVSHWLDAITQRAPVLVIFDDLHWADASTLQLLAFLARRSGEHHALVLGTYRETDLARTHPLAGMLAELRRDRLVERVSLHGFDVETVAALIQAIGGQAPPDEFVALIHDETEGNAFFVEEVLVHLGDTGTLTQQDGVWTLTRPLDELGVPEGIREVVGRRLDRLGETANRVLSIGAVCGREFDLDLVANVADMPTDELMDVLDACTTARVVVETADMAGRFEFAHALIRQTLYDELSATRRAVLHEHVGHTIETLREARLEDHLGDLAHHFLQAAPVAGATTAINYATRAAQQAVGRCAYEEAADLFERARQTAELLTPDNHTALAELWLGIGDARFSAGQGREAGRDAYLAAAECARRAHLPALLARAAYGFQWTTQEAGRSNPQTIALAEEALAALGDDQPGPRVYALVALWRELESTDQAERRRSIAAEATTLARKAQDPLATLIAGFAHARELNIAGEPDTAVVVLHETVNAAEQTGDGAQLGRALVDLVASALAAGNVDQYEQSLRRMEHVADTLHIPNHIWISATLRAGRLLMRGELADAETAIDHALSLADPNNPMGLLSYGAQLIGLRFEQARGDEVLDLLRGAVEQNPGLPAFAAALAHGLLDLGEHDEARHHYLPLFADGLRGIPQDISQPIALALLADICDLLDEDPSAGALTDWLTPRADQYIVVAFAQDCFGSVHRSLGNLARVAGRFDDAEAHLEHALVANQHLGSARWITRTQYDLARVLLQRDAPGDRERTYALVSEALPVAQQHGLRHTVGLLESLAPVAQ